MSAFLIAAAPSAPGGAALPPARPGPIPVLSAGPRRPAARPPAAPLAFLRPVLEQLRGAAPKPGLDRLAEEGEGRRQHHGHPHQAVLDIERRFDLLAHRAHAEIEAVALPGRTDLRAGGKVAGQAADIGADPALGLSGAEAMGKVDGDRAAHRPNLGWPGGPSTVRRCRSCNCAG